MDLELAATCSEKENRTSHESVISSPEDDKSGLDGTGYPENNSTIDWDTICSLGAYESVLIEAAYAKYKKSTSKKNTFSCADDSKIGVNNRNYLNNERKTEKRKLDCYTDEVDDIADRLNEVNLEGKRRKICPIESQAREAERRLLRRLTVRKLRSIKYIANFSREYISMSNFYKNERKKLFDS